jgi:electron transfer flavoprotein alpha subunit
MIALIPVRAAALPAGSAEAISECGGRALIVGSDTAAVDLDGLATDAHLLELGAFEPARWTAALTSVIADLADADIVVLPHSPDGRDLAPRLALALGRPLFAAASEVSARRVRLVRHRSTHEQRPTSSFVATLQPGTRDVTRFDAPAVVHPVAAPAIDGDPPNARDATVVEVLPPDVGTMDLAEARRIVGGGAGLESADRFDQLDRVARAIGAVMGATRVITDRSWVHHDRQIGTTGVVVDPRLYISFGVSGAVQHTSGLGHPDHIISVNTDRHCPMMAMSDLAIVADANATLDALVALLVPSVGASDG